MSNRIAAFLVVTFTVTCTVAPAWAEHISYTFESIDEVEIEGSAVKLNGLMQGEELPREIKLYTWSSRESEACERMALMSIARPGRYLLRVEHYSSDKGTCRLIRRQ